MKNSLFIALLLSCFTVGAFAATVQVDAGQTVIERPGSLIGVNIEDLNFQLYGGLYSQLLHGECFEEHVDPSDIIGLRGSDRFAVWVIPDEKGRPVLRSFMGRGGLFGEPGPPLNFPAPKKKGKAKAGTSIAGLNFQGGKLEFGQLPPDKGKQLEALANGNEQVSRHWRKVQGGTAAGSLKLLRDAQSIWSGLQSQEITFASGAGEFGIDNAGLFREGIDLAAGKPYEGLLVVKSGADQEICVSLRSADGRVLAEEIKQLGSHPGFQKIDFTLTPSGSDTHGRFAITLKKPGSIVVDYAFLQAGGWGRFNGLPVRKAMADAIIGLGVKSMRYNGSMVNKCPDGPSLYKWKKMIGPRENRPPYHGFFNPYSSHGFSVFEFMDFCEAAGIWQMFGLRIDETEQDMRDLVDYCLGGPDTDWGKKRIDSGHERPYALKAVQIGNEQILDDEYMARVKALGGAIWSKSRDVDVVLSVNVRVKPEAYQPRFIELARWAREQGQEKHLVLDSHFRAEALESGPDELDKEVGMGMSRAIAQAVPGFSLRLAPMEENGNTCDWGRGLRHARNLVALGGMAPNLERAGAANTFQAMGLTLAWDQGRMHFAPGRIVNQPPYYVDRMFSDPWLPNVVKAQSESADIEVLAKAGADGRTLALYLVNKGEAAEKISLNIAGFTPHGGSAEQIGGVEDTECNTAENPEKVARRALDWKWDPARAEIELPGRTFTVVRLE